MGELVPYHQQWFAQVPRSSRAPAIMGYGILASWIVGFAAWGGTAPIEGAVIAPGLFVATSQNKIVQHLEGGIIREILVREGDRVVEGQILMRFDGTNANADMTRLYLRHASLLAAQARLSAEAKRTPRVQFSKDLLTNASNADVRAILESQISIFEARANKVKGEIAVHEKSIRSLEFQIEGDEARIKASREQLDLIDEELDGKSDLIKLGLIRKPEYLALRRSRANLEGEIKRLTSSIGDSREQIETAEQQISRAKDAAIQLAVEEQQSVSADLKDTRERITAARGILKRLDVEAPVTGVVVKLNYHTAGGVVRAGNDILELLPAGDELVIEMNVRPQDIDNVKTGQDALVRLTALNQRTTPMVSGKVIYVSADAVPNEKKQLQDNIYIARIRIDPESAKQAKEFMPTPGMPAEVYVKTGQRTFFEYLMRPVKDTMSRAFRET